MNVLTLHYKIHWCDHWVYLHDLLVFTCRQEAFRRAVTNAKSKAQCISQTIGVQLGAALELNELSQDEIIHNTPLEQGAGGETPDDSRLREGPGRLQTIFNQQKLTYTSQVSVVFEAQPLKCCSHKKCHHKH